MKIYISQYDSPLGRIFLASSDEGLVQVGLSTREKFSSEISRKHPSAELIKDDRKNQSVISQLDEYFQGKRKDFSLPILFDGTLFQKKVWQALTKIPYGQTVTYKDIAVKIGNPKAVRAVGNANNRNPLGIVVPCHRVIGTNGKLVGYGGGLDMKEKLLKLEGAILA